MSSPTLVAEQHERGRGGTIATMSIATQPCKLCLQVRELRSSHFLPAALWVGARDSSLKDPNPVVMTRTVSMTTSKQLRTPLLCADCEDRFNKNGEKYVLYWLNPRRAAKVDFPLLERLKLALTTEESHSLNVYAADRVGIDTAKFGYFALSVLWRAAVQQWVMPDGQLTQRVELGELEESLRRFLLSEVSLPSQFALVVTVCTDEASRQVFFPPAPHKAAPWQSYGFLVGGVHFIVFVGETLPSDLRNRCCVTGARHPIFLRDCRRDTFQVFSRLAATSRPVSGLK